jgi:probable HAF family extracellular repeat protein/YD repeat-containing protein
MISMNGSTHTTTRRGLLRLAVTAGVALATPAVGTAGAAAASPVGAPADELTLLGAGAPGDTRPRTPIPGFLLRQGRYTGFDAPDAVLQTVPLGINNPGVIVGKFTTADGVDHGFRRDARGRYTTIDFPGAVATQLNKINDRGQIAGRYQNTPGGPFFRGLLVLDGRLMKLDFPGAMYTQPFGINNRGQVVGSYQTSDGRFHGFRWERGRFTTIDKPGAPGTSLVDVNDRGQILGATGDPDDPASLRAFLLDRGRFVTFRAPGAPATVPYDINNRGQIAGFTVAPTPDDPLAGARGFLLARGARGPFTPIDVPGAPRSTAYGLNDRGEITGQYENTAAAPTPQRERTTPPMGISGLPDPRRAA